ncbi:MAG TPA: aldo/keto reductase [Steroidobacteraceae bacterium]|jgi:aryl-alcohol dehydrogenase-like predicted oxidoreductase|nr:aldo/keto reductase [Steroidobacteraceae bacterium]
MSLNHYVTLGRSGLRVSPFCLGAMTFGPEWGWGSTVQDSRRIVDRFLELGGNFIDTANVYTKGHSEQILGEHFGDAPSKRERTVIATKFFGTMLHGEPNSGGAGRKALMAACEHSLRRLRTDYIDLYWMHCWDIHTPIDETMRALDDLVTAGKVRYIGFSDTPAWKVMEAQMTARFRGWSPLIALQLEYSLLERTIEGELVPLALAHGLGITPWSPLKSGVLTGKYTRANAGKVQAGRGEWATSALNDKAYNIIEALVSIAREADSTPARVALAWVQQRPGVTSTIIGARTLQQLEDNLAALQLQLTAEQIAKLDALSTPQLNFPFDFVKRAPVFSSSGASINGIAAAVNPLSPTDEQDRF